MTGDFLDPFVENNKELKKCYDGTLKAVKLGLPVLYKQILKLVCDLAKAEIQKANEGEGDFDAASDGNESYDLEDEEEKEAEADDQNDVRKK